MVSNPGLGRGSLGIWTYTPQASQVNEQSTPKETEVEGNERNKGGMRPAMARHASVGL
jgi:hypothetical protein